MGFMQPVFQRSNLASMMAQMVTAGDHMLMRWDRLGGDAEVNLADEMMQLTLEVITQTMFSTSVLNNIGKIAPALDTCLRYAAKTVANPLTLALIFPTPANQKFKHAHALLDDVIYGIIEQRRQQTAPHNDLLAMLLNASDAESGEKMTDRQIRDEVITIFSAGHETTATLLTWTLYLLAKHPEVLAKVKAELASLQGKTPGEADLPTLTYTRAVLNEAMHFRPPVGIIMRKVKKDTEIDGYALKANSLVIFNIYNLHHHIDFWDKPEEFNPDRFLTTEKRRYSYMPFGTGERICIGNHFALMESQLLLSMIIQKYEVQLVLSLIHI